MASFPSRERINLRIYIWYSLPDLKHEAFRFVRIPLLNAPCRNETFRHFNQFYQTVTMETMTVTKILTSVLAIYFQVLYKLSMTVQTFITIKWQEKKILFLTTLRSNFENVLIATIRPYLEIQIISFYGNDSQAIVFHIKTKEFLYSTIRSSSKIGKAMLNYYWNTFLVLHLVKKRVNPIRHGRDDGPLKCFWPLCSNA